MVSCFLALAMHALSTQYLFTCECGHCTDNSIGIGFEKFFAGYFYEEILDNDVEFYRQEKELDIQYGFEDVLPLTETLVGTNVRFLSS